jgi:structural maintenance of chromosome 3 (chondroitin sulfate proteoglycan 6)
VSTLCVMKDSDRLGLLKEIAGTIVYEERKAESLKILLETTNKQSHIEEVLVFIDERLGEGRFISLCHPLIGELEREKEELVVYDQLDRQRRALRYTLYSIELTKVLASFIRHLSINLHRRLNDLKLWKSQGMRYYSDNSNYIKS